MADVAAIHRRPLLIRLRDDRFAIGVQYEQALRPVNQTAAAADAALALHPHHDAPLGMDAEIALLRPLARPIERGAGRAIALFDFFPQVIEREHRHVLAARPEL